MNYRNVIIWLLCCFFYSNSISAQQQRADSAAIKEKIVPLFDSSKSKQKDTVARKVHDPRKATFRSAVLPGWGQAYNREYWKIPIVYAALGITGGFFVYNNNWYHKTKKAYDIRVNKDTARFGEIDPQLKTLEDTRLAYYRNQFRKDRDYSVLYFLFAWGLNVVDATVFGHLKEFDVSDNLTLRISPKFNPQTKLPALSLALNFNSSHKQNMLTVK
ncbi:MAG: hypothetical protein JWN76_2871 [Chitinophagaceae bacterium]|nr:hypothetical protein [Chitinophagaceae bacterium]